MGFIARYPLLGQKDSSGFSCHVIEVALNLDELLAQVGCELPLGLHLLDLGKLLGEYFALRDQSGAQLPSLVQTAIGLCEMCFQCALGLRG